MQDLLFILYNICSLLPLDVSVFLPFEFELYDQNRLITDKKFNLHYKVITLKRLEGQANSTDTDFQNAVSELYF